MGGPRRGGEGGGGGGGLTQGPPPFMGVGGDKNKGKFFLFNLRYFHLLLVIGWI